MAKDERVRHRVLDGDDDGDGQDQDTDEAERLGGVLPEPGVVAPAANGRTAAAKSPPRLPSRPRSRRRGRTRPRRTDPGGSGTVKSPKPSAAEGDQSQVDRADLLEPGEHGLHRHRRRPGVDDLAEHVLHLELASGRLRACAGRRRRGRAPGCPRMKNAQRQPSSPPATVAMPPTSAGLMAPISRPRAEVGGAEPAADADGIGVGDQRRMDRRVRGLGHPDPQAGEEEGERVDGQAGQEHEERRR